MGSSLLYIPTARQHLLSDGNGCSASFGGVLHVHPITKSPATLTRTPPSASKCTKQLLITWFRGSSQCLGQLRIPRLIAPLMMKSFPFLEAALPTPHIQSRKVCMTQPRPPWIGLIIVLNRNTWYTPAMLSDLDHAYQSRSCSVISPVLKLKTMVPTCLHKPQTASMKWRKHAYGGGDQGCFEDRLLRGYFSKEILDSLVKIDWRRPNY